MRALAAILAVGALAAAAFGMQQQSARGASRAGSKIIDRTLSCAVGLTGGVHKVELTANTGTHVAGKPSVWKLLANVNVEDLGTRAQAAVSAGNPVAPPSPGFPPQPERLWFSAPPSCRQVPRVPFATKGLAATTVNALPRSFGSGINCYPGKHVVLRVRGSFAAPTSLHVQRYPNEPSLLAASGTIVAGRLAVLGASGRPLAYGEVFQNGKARLLVARSCDQ